MSWVAIIVDPNDNKIKIDWFYLKKIVIGIVRGDQFLYIILEVDYKYHSYCYSISLLILRSLFLGSSHCFIFSSFFHLQLPRVHQFASVDPYSISSFLKSLESSCKAKKYCSDITSSLIRPESQLQSIQCGGSSFLLDISQLPFVLYVHNAYSYQQNILKCYSG